MSQFSVRKFREFEAIKLIKECKTSSYEHLASRSESLHASMWIVVPHPPLDDKDADQMTKTIHQNAALSLRTRSD